MEYLLKKSIDYIKLIKIKLHRNRSKTVILAMLLKMVQNKKRFSKLPKIEGLTSKKEPNSIR